MNGILVIDKPAGITSHDVVARVRRALSTRRVGHTGTLDPFATGVMAVLVGNATRLAQFLDKDEKEYVAHVRFGFETDTGDVTGTAKDKKSGVPSRDEILKAITSFQGEIQQVPPMYSAKKIDGNKLYELAREGKEIERKAVTVNIGELELLDIHDDIARIRVACSAGTYIRTLAEEIAREAGSLAHLTELRRTRSGRFDLGQSVTLDELSPETPIIAANEALSNIPEFVVPADRIDKTRNGLPTRVENTTFNDGEFIRMTSPAGDLVAMGVYAAAAGTVQPKVVLS